MESIKRQQLTTYKATTAKREFFKMQVIVDPITTKKTGAMKLFRKNKIPYHICPRSMNGYLLLTFNIQKRCSGGPKANECHGNKDCPSTMRACCQNSDGCNKCVGNMKILLIL